MALTPWWDELSPSEQLLPTADTEGGLGGVSSQGLYFWKGSMESGCPECGTWATALPSPWKNAVKSLPAVRLNGSTPPLTEEARMGKGSVAGLAQELSHIHAPIHRGQFSLGYTLGRHFFPLLEGVGWDSSQRPMIERSYPSCFSPSPVSGLSDLWGAFLGDVYSV